MVPQEATMLLAQLLLMNHFLAGFSHLPADQSLFQDINGINSIEVDAGCPYGCVRCSALNGCLACKPPFYLLLRRDGARQTASCTRACPRGFYKVTKKRNGFCAKCTMRGCAECDRHHYCSRCAADYVNFFGKCIPSHPDNALETPYPRKTIYSPPAILETSGTPPSARGTRPSHRTAGSSRTTSAPSAGPPRAPSAGPRRPPSSRTSSLAPPSSGPPSSPPALVNHSRPSPAVRVRPRRPQEKRPCRKKAAKKGKADKDGERRRNWKGRKKERQNKSKKGQKAKRKGCRKRMKGRRNGAKGNATLPRGEGSPGGSDVDPPPGASPEGTPTQGPPAEPSPSSEAPVSRGEQPRRGEHLAERSPPPDDPPDGARKSGLPPAAEGLRAPTLRGLRAERTRPHGGLAGHTGTAPGKGGGRATHAASAGHRWQGLDADTRRRARARPSASGGTPKLPSRHKRRHKHAPRRRILPATRAKARTHASSVQT